MKVSTHKRLPVLCLLAMITIGVIREVSGVTTVYVPGNANDGDGGNGGGGGGGGGGSSGGGSSGGDSGGAGGGSQVSDGDGDTDGDGQEINRFGQSCVYDLDDTVELCNLETAKQKVRFELIRGPMHCERYVIKETDCLGCKYVPNKEYGPCVHGHMTKHEDLVPGSKAGCPEKRKVTKKCTHNDSDDANDPQGLNPALETVIIPES